MFVITCTLIITSVPIFIYVWLISANCFRRRTHTHTLKHCMSRELIEKATIAAHTQKKWQFTRWCSLMNSAFRCRTVWDACFENSFCFYLSVYIIFCLFFALHRHQAQVRVNGLMLDFSFFFSLHWDSSIATLCTYYLFGWSSQPTVESNETKFGNKMRCGSAFEAVLLADHAHLSPREIRSERTVGDEERKLWN